MGGLPKFVHYDKGMGDKYGRIHASKAAPPESSKPPKYLALDDLHKLMREVYTSKKRQNLQRTENQEPLETMEHHLFFFMSKRFSEKRVAWEWAQAYLRSIEKYAPFEPEVLAFGRVLQNSLPESFQQLQDELRKWVSNAFGRRLSAQTENVQECVAIIAGVYAGKEGAYLERRVRAMARQGTIHVQDLHRLLLQHQVENAKSFLEDFVYEFREVDQGRTGILDSAQIAELLRRLAMVGSGDDGEAISPGAMPKAFRMAVTAAAAAFRELKEITFSECVSMCTSLIAARRDVRIIHGERNLMTNKSSFLAHHQEQHRSTTLP